MKVDIASLRRKFSISVDFISRLIILEEKLVERKVDEEIISEISSIYSVG